MRQNVRKYWLRNAPDSPSRDKGYYELSKQVDHLLEHGVGTPWNDVFAEICSRWDRRTWAGHEVRSMVKIRPENFVRWNYCVDSQGILRRAQSWWSGLDYKYKTPVDHNLVRTDGRTFVRNEHGAWLEEILTMHRELVSREDRVFVDLVERTSHRSLSKKEIDRLIRKVELKAEHDHDEGPTRRRRRRGNPARSTIPRDRTKLTQVRSPIPDMRWARPTIWGTPMG